MRNMTIAALALAASAAPAPVAAASLDKQFDTALSRLVLSMKDGPVGDMSKKQRAKLIVCVQRIFAKVPVEKKEFVVGAANDAELKERFDRIGLEDKARLKQQVRDECI